MCLCAGLCIAELWGIVCACVCVKGGLVTEFVFPAIVTGCLGFFVFFVFF